MAAEDTAPPDYLLADTHLVALGNPGETDHNTIVLSGIEVVVPVELDVEGDPLQDDLVRLRSEDGYYDCTLHARDEDVEPDPDARYLYYRFKYVPPGVYRVSVRVGEHWSPLFRGLVVDKDGAYLGGVALGEDLPTDKPADAPARDDDDGKPRPRADCGQ